MWILLLNQSNKIIAKHKISQGGISATTVDIRIIMKYTLEILASGLILCHNHPSGNKSPSKDDTVLTNKIRESAKTIDVQLLDHIIVANDSYYSYADDGLL